MSKIVNHSVVSRKSKFILAGVGVGLAAGIVVSAFRWVITQVIELVLHAYSQFQENPMGLLWWLPLSIGLAYVLGLIVKSDPHIKGSGIPQVELQMQGKLQMNWWSVLWKKFIAGGIAIGSGLILGREGPSIQLGAAVGQGVASSLKSNKVQEQVLVSAGAGAGLAAAFNAPIAGLMFVLEEIHHHFSPSVMITTLTAALVSNFVSLQFFGLSPALAIDNQLIFPVRFYWTVVVLGLVLGILGWLYQKATFSLPVLYAKFLPGVPSHFYCIAAFILVIPIGLVSTHLLGGGGELVLMLVDHQPGFVFLIGLFICRFIFSMVSYGTGLPGGIFLPILSLGAIIGSIFGKVLIDSLGIPSEYFACFVLFSMAGYFGAIGKAPLTALLLVTEMVGGLNQLMPLGICVLSAYLTAEFLKMPPIYEVLAEHMLQEVHADHTGRRMVFEVAIPIDSPLIGQMIKEIAWPNDMLIATIRRGAKEVVTKGDVRIQTGDILIIVTDEGYHSRIYDEVNQIIHQMH